MKQILLSIAVLISLYSPINAQDYYTVQVGTFLDVQAADFDEIRSLGFVYNNKLDGNLNQVFIGGYTTQVAAQEIVNQLIAKGFNKAAVLPKDLSSGQMVTAVQIATRYTNKPIDWAALKRAGNLYVILENDRIKVLTGLFDGVADAKDAIPALQRLGYDDAFVKTANNNQIVPVTAFSTGIKEPLIPITMVDPSNPSSNPPTAPRPSDFDQPGTNIETTPKTPRVPIPEGLEPATTSPQNTTTTSTNTQKTVAPVTEKRVVVLPQIRSKTKRRSALELQKVLKAEGYYDSSLDGYYGPGTAGAYEKAMAANRTIHKYQFLAESFNLNATTTSDDPLQVAINNLNSDPNATLVVERSISPMGKAYKAYQLFVTLGASSDVNTLMNQAIRSAYEGKELTNRPPFDYRATYAYEDLEQLIQHLHYVHAAPGIDYAVPCWLSERYPTETTKARAALVGFSAHLNLQACDPFLAWDEIQLLQTIAFDITPSAASRQSALNNAASRRAELYLTDRALAPAAATAMESWNQTIWENLDQWAKYDALHLDIVKALKVTYFQANVRLEDYFMDQGFDATQAKGLALATLQTLVGVPLERFDD